MKIKALLAVATLTVSGFSYAGVENCATGNNLLTPTDFDKPSGYTLQYKQEGVCLYKKDGEEIYAQVVDLAGGADIKFKTGTYRGKQTLGNGEIAKMYDKQKLTNFYSSALNSSKFFSVINGQFFDGGRQPTFLSFPLKEGNNEISSGPDMRGWSSDTFRTVNIFTKSNTWLGEKKVAKPYPYYDEGDYNNLSESAIVGGNPDKLDKGKYSSSGRTFLAPVGGLQTPMSREYPLMVFMVAEKSTQPNMVTEMKKWGAYSQNIIMFDGGGSTQMKDVNGFEFYGISAGKSYPDKRSIPMVFEIYTH